jgi:hypothetical protein
MARELRAIRFTTEEVTAAVANMVAAQGISPRDRFRDVRIIEENGDISAIITIATKREGETREQPFPGPLLCAALIRLCQVARIPLARKATKTLARAGDTVELRLELETPVSLEDVLNADPLTKAKQPKLVETPAVDWWVTGWARRRSSSS